MTPYVFHPAALQEWRDALDYYAEINSGLSSNFDDAIVDCLERVCADPQLFRIRASTVRRVNLAPQFKEWYLAYMLWQNQVVILAIGHAKRRPFYFRSRIDETRKMF